MPTDSLPTGSRTAVNSPRGRKARIRRRRLLQVEVLEPRRILSGLSSATYDQVSPVWFVEVPPVYGPARAPVRLTLAGAAETATEPTAGSTAPTQWIVRLTSSATQTLSTLADAEQLLNRGDVDFQVLRGLGLPGQLLVRTEGNVEQIRTSLAANSAVAGFDRDGLVAAQILPNDPDFPTLTGLNNVGQFGALEDADIDAPEAWEMNTGSSGVVVGVIDSGIDVTHPDLYLNIWLNPGEIPASLKTQLADTDGDGRVTLYDLNAASNAAFVRDLNANGYIDANDLLQDPSWADGRDTDGNGFVDDFFGWNFRQGAGEPFAPNDPRDASGHGTHVAGTIGAIGNNNQGVTGINWQSSLMALKFLDEYNQGSTSDAIRAINYATEMRKTYGVNVRVLNASWGQAGAASPNLEAAIAASGEAGLLFVAAAGNGNVLGQGLDNDRTPFYPASYRLDNLLSVAATGPNDTLARFSNYGATSVDLAAPGVGVLSTLAGGGYLSANGTSMAAPHVSGVAALVWSEMPEASVSEVRQAILNGVDPLPKLAKKTVSGGRLNAGQALAYNGFAPHATLVETPNITQTGGTQTLITVRYTDRLGVDEESLDDDDVIVTRQWGPRTQLETTLVDVSVQLASGGTAVTATYELVNIPGGSWDVLDYGPYVVSIVDQQVRSAHGLTVPAGPIGQFSVRIDDDSVFYVNTVHDAVDSNVGDGRCEDVSKSCTLRAAIQESNAAAPATRTIILDAGTYALSLRPSVDTNASFATPDFRSGCGGDGASLKWSGADSGDLDVLGNVRIVGDRPATTVVDAGGIDRVMKVHPNASASLERLQLTGGVAPANHAGGGILTAGNLELVEALVSDNKTTSGAYALGGGIAAWGGTVTIRESTVSDNEALGAGGVFVCNSATASISQSTFAYNVAQNNATQAVYSGNHPGGAAFLSVLGGDSEIVNSTLSSNVVSFVPDPWDPEDNPNTENNRGGAVRAVDLDYSSGAPAISGNGRYVAFASSSSMLVPGDTNGTQDVFVFDRLSQAFERVSVSSDGVEGNATSLETGESPSISSDGRFVAFSSWATNLVPGDTNDIEDVFVFDRHQKTIERISVASNGTQGDSLSSDPSISPDGRFVAFSSWATSLVPGDTKGRVQVFVFDRVLKRIERVSVANDGKAGNADSRNPSISRGGQFVVFESEATNLVTSDTNESSDVFVVDRTAGTIRRISEGPGGVQANGPSQSPSISADGTYIAYTSAATNLVLPGSSNTQNVFLARTSDGKNLLVSRAYNMDAANSWSGAPALNGDGSFVAFESAASNLVSDDTNGHLHVFLFDRQSGAIERVSQSTAGIQGGSWSHSPTISEDGKVVSFESYATNLIPGDVDDVSDVFVRDRQADRLEPVTSGGLTRATSGLVFLESVTVVDNIGSEALSGRISTHNSLFAGNDWSNSDAADLGEGVVSEGYNILSSTEYSVDLADTDCLDSIRDQLGPLADNGGATWTHSLLGRIPVLSRNASR